MEAGFVCQNMHTDPHTDPNPLTPILLHIYRSVDESGM